MTTKRPSDPARARALRDTRVDYVVGLMTSGKWQAARSHRSLARKWEVSIGAVQDYAREASGIVRYAVAGDLDGIRSQILAGIENVRVVAMKLQKYVRTGDKEFEPMAAPNVDAALRSYELQAKLLGLMVEKRQEVTPVDMAPEEKRAELARLKLEIAEEERRLDEAGRTIQ